jgi:2-dehydro-3-deoxyglucarate aldolase/4-hydroxy-2-oxoheptanedioate aldolase
VQTNKVKQALKAGNAVTGPIVSETRTIGILKKFKAAGHDFLFLDMEHAMFDWETMVNLVQGALLADIAPIVRVTDLSYQLVARAMDTGAMGVILPRVETREQVEQAVSFAKYPPLGRRGAGGDARTGFVTMGVKEAVDWANAETMVVVQIESLAGVDVIDEIASVPGLDVVCIGPQDLSISMGLHGQFTHPDFVATLQKVVDACNKHGVATGMVERQAESHRVWYEMGMRFLVTNTDSNMIFQSASRDVSTIREFMGGTTD